ncbi:MAG: transglutaminase domain-containing protein [Desulfobacterales bacterium]|nr:transglutaminase domain-containing protein [Desulfobacterales bacterium]
MNKIFYEELLNGWCPRVSNDEALICVFEKVRDIPYGSTGERNPENIVTENLGSCSGKHILLSNVFRTLGFETRILTCLHFFNEALPFGNDYPEPLNELLQNHHIIDFHHFIKIKKGGIWLNVDATWDAHLSKFGFPINLEWRGDSDTTLAVHPIKFYPETDDVIGLKEGLIAELSPEDQVLRANFLRLLTDWFKEIRSED